MKKHSDLRTLGNHSLDRNITSIATQKLDSILPSDKKSQASRSRRPSRIIRSSSRSKSPVVIRGASRDRATFGIGGITNDERTKVMAPVTTKIRSTTPGRVITLGETTLNLTSSPLAPVTDTNVKSKPLIVGARPIEIMHGNVPSSYRRVSRNEIVHDSRSKVRDVSPKVVSRVPNTQFQTKERENRSTSPIVPTYQTNDTLSTINTLDLMDNQPIVLSSGSIDVNSVEKPNLRKSPMVPRLNYKMLKTGNTDNSNIAVAKTYKTSEVLDKSQYRDYRTDMTMDVSKSGLSSTYNTNMMISGLHVTPEVSRQRNENVVVKSPLRSPIRKQHKGSDLDLTTSSPYKYYSPGGAYIPGTNSNIQNTRLISSPIRTSNLQGRPIVRASPYRV
jgi:hypothetical protein